MPGFDVFSNDLDLHKNHFLEASAGTGKTYQIEHIVLRLIAEGATIEEILVVTFTKSAVADLKERIRQTLKRAYDSPLSYPFLKHDGEIKRIGRALALFDDAKIMTIHKFCYQNLFAEKEGSDFEPDVRRMREALKDFLRTHLHHFAPFQIDILFRRYQYDIEECIDDILPIVSKKAPILGVKSFETLNSLFQKEIQEIKKGVSLDPSLLWEDLTKMASKYREMANRKKELKGEVKEELKRFLTLLMEGKEIEEFQYITQCKEENLLERSSPPSFCYPEVIKKIEERVFPLLEEGSDFLSIFACFAEKVRNYLETKSLSFTHDDLLIEMEKKCQDPLFVEEVQKKYVAVLIDEFQDTDRLQWSIFSSLFYHKKPLYLIGDPKQSIYRFRGADITTYFLAKKAFLPEERGSLTKNYRSTPSLIAALNELFALRSPFLTLKESGEILQCPTILPDLNKKDMVWQDQKKSLHFWQAEEEEEHFSHIVEEIFLLKSQGISFEMCAVLVKDRFQAERFKKLALKNHLPITYKRISSLKNKESYKTLIELLEALFSLEKPGVLEKLLMGSLFALSTEEIEKNKEEKREELNALKEVLESSNPLLFFKKLMEKEGLMGKMLQKEEGFEHYFEMKLLMEKLAEEEKDPRKYVKFLKSLSLEESDFLSCESSIKGIQLMTIHGSKGLEFDVVFPIGLSLGAQERRRLIFHAKEHVYTFSKEAHLQEKEESELEKIRLFYVACTRAKKRLYLNLLKKEKNSPLAFFLQGKDPVALKEASFSEVKKAPLFQNPPSFSLDIDPPCDILLEHKSLNVHSFSSLATPKEHTSFQAELFSGKEIGNFLHTVLEKCDPFTFPTLLPSLLEKTPFKKWEEEIFKMVDHAFNTPLFPSVSLKQIDPKKMIKEMEFLYYSEKRACYLKGFIDLIFEHENKIYFLDWKSNSLEGYTASFLEKAMRENDYLLQGEIYTYALLKYTKLFHNLSFGGYFYIFLRGLPEGGVYFSPRE